MVQIKMLGFVTVVLVLALSVRTQDQSTPISPCPNVFEYETPGSEAGRWYGVVHVSTDSTLYSLWLNIVLDSKADILGNWIGDVTTQDNMNFKIESTQTKINPGPATAVRFFVQYNTLNKAPRLLAIRLNGREICNANNPQPALESPLSSGDSKPNRFVTASTGRPQTQPNRRQQTTPSPRPTSRPLNTDSRTPETERPQIPIRRPQDPVVRPQIPDTRTQSPDVRPEHLLQTRPVQGRPSTEAERPVYVKPVNSANPSSISGGEVSSQSYNQNQDRGPSNNNPRFTPAPPTYRPPSKQPSSSQHHDDNGSAGDVDDYEYFTGGQPTIILPSSNRSDQNTCGRVMLNRPIPLVLNGVPTLEGQWPWQIALYQTQRVDNKYICGGTLVSHRHIITAAHCVTRKGSQRLVNKDTLTVYLGKHNLRTSVDGVQIRFVSQIIIHPEYNASTFSRDVSILELKDRVTYSKWVQPACLWPSNQITLNNIVGKKGSVVGWGFDETGVATEELSLVEMPVVDTETCIRSYSEFFVRFTSEYTYCAGYRDGTSVCNGDSGGGMVFKFGESWYLRGLVSLSVARQNECRCDPSHYVVFSDLAKFLPWLQENLFDY
ncbi:clotting factor C isoform X2 [Bombyx mori]|uniref:Peptidase S1 domain-containing protein n=1 Tax=Bombyx mori TaxID=7091 RepID=A0A8R1WIP0_BOMMO|nr:clotting factor C isoform X2 [Bombyx mori]